MKQVEKVIRQKLLDLKDDKNQKFLEKLIPNIPANTILGIKTPNLRAFSRELAKDKNNFEFMECLPHKYLEENTLHGFLIEQIKDFGEALNAINNFLPYINNWATCDSISPKIFKKYPCEVYETTKIWIKDPHPFTIRFAVKTLLSNYLDENFNEEMLELVSSIKNKDYYVQMMQARYFATALVKQEASVLNLLKNKVLDQWVQNKTIQKARESRRISEKTKIMLLDYKIE